MSFLFQKIFQITACLVIGVCYPGCTHIPVATSLGLNVPPNLPEELLHKKIGVALVLGGGGAKGLAHVGVLEVLEEEGIPIDLIVGTSSGAAVGAIYSSYVNAKQVKEILFTLGKWDVLDLSITSICRMVIEPSGPISGYNFEKFFIDNLPEQNIEELSIPFASVAVDIETSSPFIIKSGPIAPAVHASAAIPPFFAPVKLYGHTLVDGGVALPVPVSVAQGYNPQLIIAVDISGPPSKGRMGGSIELTYRALEISYYALSRMQSRCADIDIHPDLKGFGLFDDDRNEEIYLKGIEAAKIAIPEIKKKLSELNIALYEPGKNPKAKTKAFIPKSRNNSSPSSIAKKPFSDSFWD